MTFAVGHRPPVPRPQPDHAPPVEGTQPGPVGAKVLSGAKAHGFVDIPSDTRRLAVRLAPTHIPSNSTVYNWLDYDDNGNKKSVAVTFDSVGGSESVSVFDLGSIGEQHTEYVNWSSHPEMVIEAKTVPGSERRRAAGKWEISVRDAATGTDLLRHRMTLSADRLMGSGVSQFDHSGDESVRASRAHRTLDSTWPEAPSPTLPPIIYEYPDREIPKPPDPNDPSGPMMTSWSEISTANSPSGDLKPHPYWA